MNNLREGFDFNVALENDINDNIDIFSNRVIYNSMIDGIKKIFKKYNKLKILNININIFVDNDLNTIIINVYKDKEVKLSISINNVNNKFIMDINETLSDITLGGLLGNNGKINICKDIINFSKDYLNFDKIEIGIIVQNDNIYKFNNLHTCTLNSNNLYFIKNIIKFADIVFKISNSMQSYNYNPIRNLNFFIDHAWKYMAYRDIRPNELKSIINYINKHYISPGAFIFMKYDEDINNLKDLNTLFSNGFDVIRFNDNDINYDKNDVNITESDIWLVCRNVIKNKTKKLNNLIELVTNLYNNTTNINKLYSRLALGIICLPNYSNTILSNITNYNKNITFNSDIFKAYYNKIHDDIVQHGPIYQTIRENI